MTDYWSQANVGKAQAPETDYWGSSTGSAPVPPRSAPQEQPQGWGDWITSLPGKAVEAYKGKQDPAYAGTGTVFEQFRDDLRDPTGYAALAGASDAQMADIIRNQLGDRFIRSEKDANGYDVFVTRGADGKEQRGYVNKPGLDTQDAWRAFYGALPYVATGGGAAVAARGAGLGVNMLAQGAAATGTSLAGDLAQGPLGSEQGLELDKAATVGAFGAAGPLVGKIAGSLWSKFVTVPGLVDKSTGRLTARGAEYARRAGLDPAELDADFSQRFARAVADTGDPAQAATRAGAEAFDIPVTRGQATKDPYLLTQEEGMRRRLYGQSAQDTMRGFDERQASAIRQGALGPEMELGQQLGDVPSVARTIAPNRNPGAIDGDRMSGSLGDDIAGAVQATRSAAKAEESALWDDGVRGLAATPQSLGNLRPMIQDRLIAEGVSDMTPTLEAATKAIGDFADGKLPVVESGGISLKATHSVDDMRRRLGRMVGSATDPTDKHNVGIVYDAFNDWIGESAKANLLAGDPAKAMQLVEARAFTKAVREMFDNNAAGSRLSNILSGKADSGERVINELFGSGKSVNQGSVTALKTIKAALDRFTPEGAEAAWSDIKLAYWTKLVMGRNGEMLGPMAITNNIKNALSHQRSVVNVLFERQEQMQIRKFLSAVEAASFKPPNASGSGYTAASFIKDGVLKLLDAFGIGTPARAAIGMSGLDKAFGSASAQRAVSGSVVPKRPNLGPVFAPLGQQYDRQR